MVRTCTGNNSYALKKELRELKRKFVDEYGDLSLEIIDGEEASYEQIKDAVSSVPFLAEKKLVVVYEPGKSKDIAEKIEELFDITEFGNDLIIVEPKPDKRSSYYKTLKKNSEMVEFK